MSSDDRQTSAPPVVTVVPAEATVPVAANDLLALGRTTSPALVEPDMLVDGLRHLQQRIPEFTQLSTEEKRSHARAANLDPEFLENGLHAAEAWPDTELVVNRSGAALREEDVEIRDWDKAIREWRAILDGLEAANLKRKHRLGTAILQIYNILGVQFSLRNSNPKHPFMRPYYENMKRAYLKTQGFRKKTKKKEEPPAE